MMLDMRLLMKAVQIITKKVLSYHTREHMNFFENIFFELKKKQLYLNTLYYILYSNFRKLFLSFIESYLNQVI